MYNCVISRNHDKINNMKKIIYLILILFFVFLFLKSCLKKDMGFDDDNSKKYPPMSTPSFEFEKRYTKTSDGVDYLVSTAPLGQFGGELITSSIGEGPKTFNPFVSTDATSSSMADMMYDGLLTTNAYTGEVEPKLAKSFEVLPDKKTYIIKLRKGVKWSDGKEITSEDVYYTYNTIIFGGFGNTSTRDSLYINGKLPTVEILDRYTIKFKTPVPFAPFLRNLSSPIAPEHIFKKATDKGKNYFNGFLGTVTNPQDFVVSGAFKLKEYVPAQRVVFEKNNNYYVVNKKGQKLPYLDNWVVLIVGDLNNQTVKFDGGEIDVISLQGSATPRYRANELRGDYKLYNLGATTTTTFMVFNLNTRKNSKGEFYVSPKKQMWFNDLNFRSAIDYAIDRENLVLNILNGIGQPLFSSEPPSSIYLNKNVAKGHPRDLERAKELLKASGFILKDNILYDKLGNKVEFELATNAGNTQREATGVSIKEDLAQLGIKVNFKPVEFNTLVNRLSNTFDFDVVIMGLTSNPLEPHSGYNVWNSSGALHLFNQRREEEKGVKLLSFEKKLDDIFNKAPLELDFNKRKKMYEEYQQIVYREAPFIYLYSPCVIVAVRKKFGNIFPTRLGETLHNFDEIFVLK